ncbi:uncharacterized protein LOC112041520 [Lingula anatina]|uniref:Uncharacterized protein LOC112041520 n=1 Tax=Lingula anatina TaxID=7574 RepID=A0A2R2MK83_LINAN|nr:uncharacterized protein LOC112041520 [Lingula anatina]|eukprot:XP_023930631.1 uncharacterized protein LOC112041520 [Lingula anatina]
MERSIDEKSNAISAKVKEITSKQVKTLEAEKEKLEMNKISIQSIRDFAQQLTETGSDIEVMTHSKKLQTRIQELETLEPVFDSKITKITFTPGKTKMDVVLQFPKMPEPRPLSIKTGSITAKTYQGPLDAYFGSLKQKRTHCPELKKFQNVPWLDMPERTTFVNVKCRPWDMQCTDDRCVLVVHGITVPVFSRTGQCKREIRIERGGRRIAIVSNDRFVVTSHDKCCRLLNHNGQIKNTGYGKPSTGFATGSDTIALRLADGDEVWIYLVEATSFITLLGSSTALSLVARIPLTLPALSRQQQH